MLTKQARDIACLIDSDITIDFLRGRAYAGKLLEQWSEKGLLAVSAVTHFEVYQGMRASEEKATSAFLDGITSVAVDVPVARKAGRLMGELRSRGITLGAADALIAATALHLNVPLLTNNSEHYPFPDLSLVPGMEGTI